MKITHLCALTLASFFAISRVHADQFGTAGNTFTIDFVTVGNPGNGNDAGAGGGLYSSPYGGVPYVFQMGVTEVSGSMVSNATASGLLNVSASLAGSNQPATNVTWYEAAAFVNWMNASKGHQAAYNLNSQANFLTLWTSPEAWQAGGENLYRHKDAVYFLPSENEWYKAAYHKNDGVTANYWDYATASNTIPTAVSSGTATGTAVFYNGINAYSSPANVSAVGGASSYGTRGQNGNVDEMMESAFDSVNDQGNENRAYRGGYWFHTEDAMRSSGRFSRVSSGQSTDVGFRVASVPEPSATILMVGSAVALLARRRRGSSF